MAVGENNERLERICGRQKVENGCDLHPLEEADGGEAPLAESTRPLPRATERNMGIRQSPVAVLPASLILDD